MMNGRTICLFVFLSLFNFGCSKTVYETITSDPTQADIYWGKTSANLEKSEYQTPFTKSVSESKLEPWCFQVKKDGYRKSDIYCRENELSWLINVELVPLKTTITSEPPGAAIYWGPTKEKIYKTEHVTPHVASDVNLGASWKEWYFQVKKDEYKDSEVVIKAREESDRDIHFDLTRVKQAVSETKSDKTTITSKPPEATIYREAAKKKVHKTVPVKKDEYKDPKRIIKTKEEGNRAVHYESKPAKRVVWKNKPNQWISTKNKVTISWNNEDPSNILGTEIERRRESDENFKQIAIVGPNETTYTDTGLLPGETYYYRVRTYNSGFKSDYANEIKVKILDNK
jgi:hypothetical protein